MKESNTHTKKLYLLGGSGSCKEWWAECLPCFSRYEAVPIELPGHGSNYEDTSAEIRGTALWLLKNTEKDSNIFAAGIGALMVLHTIWDEPRHFNRIILMAPVGAYLHNRKFVKRMSNPLKRSTAHYILSSKPSLLKKKFSEKEWTDTQYKMIADGYKQCRVFKKYFETIKPHKALELLDRIERPIELIWGMQDNILSFKQASAWSGILPRADLSVKLKEGWGHYPYIDSPQEFAEEIERESTGFKANTKSGRLLLAKNCGLSVPDFVTAANADETKAGINELSDKILYTVRSAAHTEDKAESSEAGLKESFLRVTKSEIAEKAKKLFDSGIDTIIIQEFIEPEVSGIAFTRNISTEVEWVHGHLELLTSGKVKPFSSVISKMKGVWQKNWNLYVEDTPFILVLSELDEFLKKVSESFHYQHLDIEWAWDKNKFYLLQARPVTEYTWRRLITAANIDEILPRQVSRLMEHAQRSAALSIGKIYSVIDGRNAEDNEPFTARFDNASYINSDLFLSRFKDWGLPGSLYYKEIGGAAPAVSFKMGSFIKSIPIFAKMIYRYRKDILKSGQRFKEFEKELVEIDRETDENAKEEKLVKWFIRLYIFIVQTNIIIKALISTSVSGFLAAPRTVYGKVNSAEYPHRIKYESDPASPRNSKDEMPLQEFPQWNGPVKFFHNTGLPGLKGKYIELREWFRDNNMRLFHRLHNRMQGSAWLNLYEGIRYKTGTFWQDGTDTIEQKFSLLIYPGKAEGKAGRDIIICETLEPGHLEEYKKAKAVIATTGGRLSHGAILLREIKKPSAIIPGLEEIQPGTYIKYDNGQVNISKNKEGS